MMSIARIRAIAATTPVKVAGLVICAIALLISRYNLAKSDPNACFQRDVETVGIWQFPGKKVYLANCGLAFDSNGAPIHFRTNILHNGDREIYLDWLGTEFSDRFPVTPPGTETTLTNNFGAQFKVRRLE